MHAAGTAAVCTRLRCSATNSWASATVLDAPLALSMASDTTRRDACAATLATFPTAVAAAALARARRRDSRAAGLPASRTRLNGERSPSPSRPSSCGSSASLTGVTGVLGSDTPDGRGASSTGEST